MCILVLKVCGAGLSLHAPLAREVSFLAPARRSQLGYVSAHLARTPRAFIFNAQRSRIVQAILSVALASGRHGTEGSVQIDFDPTITFGNRGIFVSSLMTRGCGDPRGCG